MNWIGIWKFGT